MSLFLRSGSRKGKKHTIDFFVHAESLAQRLVELQGIRACKELDDEDGASD